MKRAALLPACCLLAALEALAGVVYLLSIPPDPKNSLLFGYSAARLLAAGLLLAAFLAAGILAGLAWRRRQVLPAKTRQAFEADPQMRDTWLVGTLALLAGGLGLLSLDPTAWVEITFYLVRLRPLLLWLTLAAAQTLLLVLLLPGSPAQAPPAPGRAEKARPKNLTLVLFALALGLGLGLRLYLAFAYHGNYDQYSWDIVADAARQGKPVYLTGRYNYSPVWLGILLLLEHLTRLSSLPLHVWSRGFLACIDLLNGLLIGLIAARCGSAAWRAATAVYLLNPVAVLLVGYHGQIEALASLPLLTAAWLWLRRRTHPPLLMLWLLGSLALILKHNLLFGVWTLFVFSARRPGRAVLLMLASGLLFLMSFLPCLPQERDAIITNVFLYQSMGGDYGLGAYLPPALHRLVFFALLALLPLAARWLLKRSLPEALEFSFVAFVAATFGFAEQYMLLPVLWGSIFFANPFYWLFTLFGGLFIANSPNNLNLNGSPVFFDPAFLTPAWWMLAGWFIWRLVLPNKGLPRQAR